MAWKIKGYLEVDSLEIPFYARTEYRKSITYSVGRNKVNIKLPIHFTQAMIQRELIKVEKWLAIEFQKNEKLRNRFEPKDFIFNDSLVVMGDKYFIESEETNLKSNRIKLVNKDTLLIRYESGLSETIKSNVTKRLLSKVMAGIYKQRITKLVTDINDEYFQEPINSVKLKYNKSNWGSCSSKNNINLSTRLLLCPDEEVIKYVIVHELSHLKEMNHSLAFWSIVEMVMPNYKKQERWLKDYGNTLDF